MQRQWVDKRVVVVGLLAAIGCGAGGGGSRVAAPGPKPVAQSAERAQTFAKGEQDRAPRTRDVDVQTATVYRAGRPVQVPVSEARGPEVFELDLGEDWTPYLFTDGEAGGTPVRNAYRPTYLALARGDFADDRHGRRAARDGDLEVYGILPTLGRLRQRFEALEGHACAEVPGDPAIGALDGPVRVRRGRWARRFLQHAEADATAIAALVAAAGLSSVDALDPGQLDRAERRRLRRHLRTRTELAAVRAVQARLACGGYLPADAEVVPGVLDGPTHAALRAFERRQGIALGGRLRAPTREALQRSALDNARRAVLRVLTERAVHTLGVIEDGSSGETYVDAEGTTRPVPNLRAQLQAHIESAFGLQTPASTRRFLAQLPSAAHHVVRVRGPRLPDYYAATMSLHLQYDPGDVWYDFPFDAEGKRIPQPVEQHPEVRVRLRHGAQDIVLARFPTTVGGWHRELSEGVEMWKYKPSPVGRRVWDRIVAAPVWLPPASTPDRELLTGAGRPRRDVVGPSHASAYGLAVAYHRTFTRADGGDVELLGDQGIRTHGSVNYRSIGRGYSHGCHRLHNDTALRLMGFVLTHTPHVRTGNESLTYARALSTPDGRGRTLRVREGGYGFVLTTPLPVHVLRGRVKGQRVRPIRTPLPQYDETLAAYVMPDGTHVRIEDGAVIPLHAPDAAEPEPQPGVQLSALSRVAAPGLQSSMPRPLGVPGTELRTDAPATP